MSPYDMCPRCGGNLYVYDARRRFTAKCRACGRKAHSDDLGNWQPGGAWTPYLLVGVFLLILVAASVVDAL